MLYEYRTSREESDKIFGSEGKPSNTIRRLTGDRGDVEEHLPPNVDLQEEGGPGEDDHGVGRVVLLVPSVVL